MAADADAAHRRWLAAVLTPDAVAAACDAEADAEAKEAA